MKSKNIWFKQKYVEDILSGKKTDTFRKLTEKIEVGQTLIFSVGPKKPFARAVVTKVNDLPASVIEKERLAVLIGFYGVLPEYRQVVFCLEEIPSS